MAATTSEGSPVRRGSRGKRQDVVRAGLTVFARDGYSRASIDVIAREAEVSTRTIYNHFTDKAELFATVIVESATRVAEAQVAVVRELLGGLGDAEHGLREFGRAWARPDPAHTDHFALVRQIHADAEHIPVSALEAWQQAGPQRVRREIADHLSRLGQRGSLTIDDPDRAAVHLVALVTAEVGSASTCGARPLGDDEIRDSADAGADAFLRAYRRTTPTERPGDE